MDNKQIYRKPIRGGVGQNFYPLTQYSAIVDMPPLSEGEGKLISVDESVLKWVSLKTINHKSLFGEGNIDVAGGTAQSDWNENNPEEPSYVANRTHYTEPGALVCNVTETSGDFLEDGIYATMITDIDPAPEWPSSVEEEMSAIIGLTFNGIEIPLGDLRSYISEEDVIWYYGNLSLISSVNGGEGEDLPDTGEDFLVFIPFGIAFLGNASVYGDTFVSGSITVNQETVHKLDNKYLNKIPASNVTGLSDVATTGNYYSLSNRPTDVSAFYNDAEYVSQNTVLTYKPIPYTWNISDTMQQLIASIAADESAVTGKSYRGTVHLSDLPESMVQAELQIDIYNSVSGLGKTVLFTVTSEDTAPYHWEYTSVYGSTGEWRSFGGGSTTSGTTIYRGEVDLVRSTTDNLVIVLQTTDTSIPNYCYILITGGLPTTMAGSFTVEIKNTSYTTIKNVTWASNKTWFPDGDCGLFIIESYDLYQETSEKWQFSQPDWNQTTNTAPDYIKNKPTIPDAQIQSDWSQSDNTKLDYIKNKPTIPSVTGKADKVSGATNGNLAGLDSNGNLTDSGVAKGILDKMPSTLGTAGQILQVNSGVTALEFATPAVLHGIPAGGNAGQVLKKTSATDYDVNWANASETLPSAYCTTSGSTAAKKANCSLYVTQANQYLQVLIGSANTYQGALTLNINSAGAKPIYINGTVSSSSNYTLPNGTYFVFYDGTNYYFRTDGKLPMKDAAFGGSYNDLVNKPIIPDAVSGTNDGTNWTTLTIGSVTKNIPGSGGLTNHDFTHVANTTVSTSTTTITFATNQRCSQMITVSADIGLTFDIRNLSDNYLWIKNTGNSDIDVTISSVVNDQTTISNVYVPTDGISVPAGKVCEIGIIRNADGAFITSRNDLEL